MSTTETIGRITITTTVSADGRYGADLTAPDGTVIRRNGKLYKTEGWALNWARKAAREVDFLAEDDAEWADDEARAAAALLTASTMSAAATLDSDNLASAAALRDAIAAREGDDLEEEAAQHALSQMGIPERFQAPAAGPDIVWAAHREWWELDATFPHPSPRVETGEPELDYPRLTPELAAAVADDEDDLDEDIIISGSAPPADGVITLGGTTVDLTGADSPARPHRGVPCPTCQAPTGRACRYPSGYHMSRGHAARRRLTGEDAPPAAAPPPAHRAIACPTCDAPAGRPCVLPSGHRLHKGHAARQVAPWLDD